MNDASSPPPREPSDPFVQLLRSHRRLEEACTALATAVAGHDIETINDVASFFARQVRRHEEDEDGSLFPRLAGRAELRDVLARLTAEHRTHAELQLRLAEAVAGRTEPGVDLWTELGGVAEALIGSYRAHIDEEERTVFPAARELLGPSELAAMQDEIDVRRGRSRA